MELDAAHRLVNATTPVRALGTWIGQPGVCKTNGTSLCQGVGNREVSNLFDMWR